MSARVEKTYARLWLIPIWATLGFLGVVAALPQSRWVLLRQWDVLAGRWTAQATRTDTGSTRYVVPTQPALGWLGAAPDPTGEFLLLLAPPHPDADAAASDARYRRLFDMCLAARRADYWAQYVRIASPFGTIVNLSPRMESKGVNITPRAPKGPKTSPPRDGSGSLRTGGEGATETKRVPIETLGHPDLGARIERERCESLLAACEAGAALDPQNAFFPLIGAGAEFRLGHPERARQVFLAASRLPRIQDYAQLEPELRYRYLVDHIGYRGNQLHAWVLAAFSLPHVSVMWTTARHYAESVDPSERVAAARIGSRLMSDSDTAIGVYIGRRIVAGALGLSRKSSNGFVRASLNLAPKPSALDGARRLAALVPGADDLTRIAERYETIRPLDFANPAGLEDAVANNEPAYSAWSSLALALVPVGLLVMLRRSRRSRFDAAAPYLVWSLPLVADHVFGDIGQGAVVFGLATFLFIPAYLAAKSPRPSPEGRADQNAGSRSKVNWLSIVDAFGILCTLAAVVATFNFPYLAIPTVMFVLALWVTRRPEPVPALPAALLLVGACALAAAAWVATACRGTGSDGICFGMLATIGTMAFLPALRPGASARSDVPSWIPIAGVACLVLGPASMAMVYRDISSDRFLAVVGDEMSHGGARLRQEASK